LNVLVEHFILIKKVGMASKKRT